MKKMTPEMISRVAARFRALADETRIRILLRLREGEANVSALAAGLGIGQASMSKHLALLRDEGLLELRREGNQAFYTIRDRDLFELCALVCDGVRRHAEERHQALTR
jgi:DNA-binding transcriptional ArsR family regulator